jgi:hypothetical protein
MPPLTVLHHESIFGISGWNNTGGSLMRCFKFAVLTILSVAVVGVQAADVWVDKDWKQWSKEDVKVLLEHSPWAKGWAKGQVNTSSAVPSVSGAGQEGAAAENAPTIHYYLQIRSAEPVREAVIRQFQLDQGYDTSMTEAQKKSFDERAAQFLNRKYDDVINVHVVYSSNIQEFERELAVYWQNITQDSVPNDFYLITERGNHIAPTRYVAPKTGAYEFDLSFPRVVNGEPVIHDGDKGFSIQFTNPAVGAGSPNGSTPSSAPKGPSTVATGGATARKPGSTVGTRSPLPPTGGSASPTNHSVANFKAERVLVEFNVPSMMWQGKLTY